MLNEYKKEAQQAKVEWLEAWDKLNYVDPDLVDSVILEITSKEKKYMALTKRIKCLAS